MRRIWLSCGTRFAIDGDVVTETLPKPPRGFRHVPGFEGYAVSRDGRVVSCRLTGRHLSREHLIKPKPTWHGLVPTLCRTSKKGPLYAYVNLRPTAAMSRKQRRPIGVHSVVLRAFVGPCPSGMVACHNNGNSLCNRLRNLRWDTQAKNNLDQARHGTRARGEMRPEAKLTARKVQYILMSNETAVSLAAKYGVTRSTVTAVRIGKNWKHIKRRSR